MTEKNIKAGFRASGVWSINPDIFDESDFMPNTPMTRVDSGNEEPMEVDEYPEEEPQPGPSTSEASRVSNRSVLQLTNRPVVFIICDCDRNEQGMMRTSVRFPFPESASPTDFSCLLPIDWLRLGSILHVVVVNIGIPPFFNRRPQVHPDPDSGMFEAVATAR